MADADQRRRRSRFLQRAIVALHVVITSSAMPAWAQNSGLQSTVEAEQDSALASAPGGFAFLPTEPLFESLLADPRQPRFHGLIERMDTPFGDFDVATATLGATFELAEYRTARPGDGVQLALSGSSVSFFNLDGLDNDLINVDYFIGVPLSARRGPWSVRAGPYHQSSHLSHELFLNEAFGPPVEPDKLSFEYFETILSRDFADLRLYGGMTRIFHSVTDLDRWWATAGLEWRADHDRTRTVRPLAAVHVRSWNQNHWDPEWSVRAGVQVQPSTQSQALNFALQYFDGPLHHGTFHRYDVRSVGFSIWIDF